ncbi:MAG: hypothetical protein ACOCXP_04065, partial [Candidatus Dojkabacteria bacterium]
MYPVLLDSVRANQDNRIIGMIIDGIPDLIDLEELNRLLQDNPPGIEELDADMIKRILRQVEGLGADAYESMSLTIESRNTQLSEQEKSEYLVVAGVLRAVSNGLSQRSAKIEGQNAGGANGIVDDLLSNVVNRMAGRLEKRLTGAPVNLDILKKIREEIEGPIDLDSLTKAVAEVMSVIDQADIYQFKLNVQGALKYVDGQRDNSYLFYDMLAHLQRLKNNILPKENDYSDVYKQWHEFMRLQAKAAYMIMKYALKDAIKKGDSPDEYEIGSKPYLHFDGKKGISSSHLNALFGNLSRGMINYPT